MQITVGAAYIYLNRWIDVCYESFDAELPVFSTFSYLKFNQKSTSLSVKGTEDSFGSNNIANINDN